MNWELFTYDTFTGKYNMEFDLQLVKNCESENPILRFYGWKPHCISIGANQSYNEIDSEAADYSNIQVVKRPTGGRAILHADELTYSVIMPNSKQFSGKRLYEDISNAIVYGLRLYHNELQDVELENSNPNFAELLKESSGSLCFASTAKSEIKYKGKKLVGSAQRRLGNTVLQHGSILIGKEHHDLVKYLNVPEEEKIYLGQDIRNKTTEISSIINTKVDLINLQATIITGFEHILGANFKYAEQELIPQ